MITDTIDVFDFTAYEDVTSADVRIKNPATGAPTPMAVTIAGPEHPERKRRTFARQRKLRAALLGLLERRDGEVPRVNVDAIGYGAGVFDALKREKAVKAWERRHGVRGEAAAAAPAERARWAWIIRVLLVGKWRD